jgi:hypothetical protein
VSRRPLWHQQRAAGNRQLREAEVVRLDDYRPPADPAPDDLARAHLADMAEAYLAAGDTHAALLCGSFIKALESR